MSSKSGLVTSLENTSSDDELVFENANSNLPSSEQKNNEQNVDDLIGKQNDLKLDDDAQNSDEDQQDFVDTKNDADEESRKDYEKTLTETELLANKEQAGVHKVDGNEFYKNADYNKAIETYTLGIDICPLNCSEERGILYGNRGAAYIQLDNKQLAIQDCTKSLELKPKYMKVLIR